MDRTHALIRLGFSAKEKKVEEETVFEYYEEAVFKEATFFMRRAFIPKLAQRRIEILHELNEALAVLTDSYQDSEKDYTSINGLNELEKIISFRELVDLYNIQESKIKLSLSNAEKADLAIRAYKSWLPLHFKYGSHFIKLGRDAGLKVRKDIGLSENIQASDLIMELNEGKLFDLVEREFSRMTKMYAMP